MLNGRLDSVLNATVCITLTAFSGYLEIKLKNKKVGHGVSNK